MRFTIRDLLWLTVVVALGAGWWMEHRKVTELQGTLRMAEIGSAMMAARIESLSDEFHDLAKTRGLPVFEPIYVEELESKGEKHSDTPNP